MVRKIIINSAIALLIFLFACEDDKSQENTIPPKVDKSKVIDTLAKSKPRVVALPDEDLKILIAFSKEDSKALFLIDSLPIGCSFKKANATVQSLSKPSKKEGIAQTTFTLHGEEALLQLQFAKDTLQNIMYMVKKKESNQADQYFKAVRNFYSKKIGAFEKEKTEEESRFSPSYYFNYKGCQLTISNNINEGNVSWIFESKE